MHCEQLLLRINESRIWYLKFILEGYDGVAVLSTQDRQQGVVQLRFCAEQRALLMSLLADLAPALRRPELHVLSEL
jgi:hypothetical protein